MFKFRYCFAVFAFVVSISISSLAQAAPAKSVLINTSSFYDEKAGITQLIAAEKKVDGEFVKDIKSLEDDNARLAVIASELEKQPVGDAGRTSMLAKKEEGEALQRSLTYRKTDLEARVNKRRDEVIGPITFDIGKVISEFGKKNNYGAIFDASKLAEAGALLFVGESTDITKDFIAYYNARSAAVPIAK